jgi:hypothetical protein
MEYVHCEQTGQLYQLFRGTPKSEAPKTWDKIGLIRFKEFPETNYNSNLFTLYRLKNGQLGYSVYQDGCFYELFGKLIKY